MILGHWPTRRLLSSSVRNIVESVMISVTEFITSSQIRARLSRPKASVARFLSKMCDEGLLQAGGAGRATKYQKSVHYS